MGGADCRRKVTVTAMRVVGPDIKLRAQERKILLFLKKKKQKDFANLARGSHPPRAP
jgi:hypothetical protein